MLTKIRKTVTDSENEKKKKTAKKWRRKKSLEIRVLFYLCMYLFRKKKEELIPTQYIYFFFVCLIKIEK